ncbi:hypothetical protein OEZ85_002037 [Tetradesmus obliquus]|uniref:SAM domain-containing protein n=1 Tax=Tetradesmus obliquus TaxID=3088 RepID=A0ABY8U1V6_TETOB|nr:hypothetical protein OEZ85_002037 [Tetradesmus obliquus]
MESDVSEASIAYDEQFEDEDVNGDITAAAPTASPFPAAPLSGRSAAAALLTDTELDEYLDDEEPRTAANNYSSKVSDVCDWVEGIGLPQYRKKFMHHCIGGRLLLRLTDELLKKELGIGPLATSPGALGPAAGRISVYEQRAKLLFELGRAQARAAAQSSSAAQVGDVARLAAEEVARLQGQLADLDRKNRLQVEYGAGSVDSRGHIPWQHVGAGTHAGHPHPESHARPWDPPDTDLTFSPKISAKSQQLMAEQRGQGGNGGFLARLDNDLKRRQVKIKELERRYNAFGPGAVSAADAAAAAKAAAADMSLVLGFLSQRGWADLSVPTGSSSGGGGGGMDAAAQQELDEQLDEVVESHSRELSLGEAQLRGILAERGHKKVAALAAVVRTQQFMDRYKADLSTRDSRLSELQEKWFKQQLQGAPASTGPTGRAPAAPLTAEQRDMQQALQWFRQLGWDVAEPEDDCEDQLSALIKRARAYKAEVEKLHDKAAAAAATGAQQAAAAAVGEPQINWQGIPWRDDGLNDLIQKVLDAQRAAADSAASKAAAASKPSAVDAALKAAGKAGSIAGSMNSAAAEGRGEKKNPLDHAVQLLAGMRWAGLDQLDAAAGAAKKLAVYRALRTQQFLEFTANDLAAREAKQRALWAEFEASRRGKVVSKAELDEFYARLQADGERRKAELAKAKADKEERAARALALVSVGAGRSTRSRPASAK